MYQYKAEAGVMMEQGAGGKPVGQLPSIRCVQDGLECVVGFRRSDFGGNGQEMQVVVTENNNGAVPKALNEAQYLEGLGPTVYEVACEPEDIVRSVKVDPLQKCLECGETSLNVTDGIHGHELDCLDGGAYGDCVINVGIFGHYPFLFCSGIYHRRLLVSRWMRLPRRVIASRFGMAHAASLSQSQIRVDADTDSDPEKTDRRVTCDRTELSRG